jgi:hypothetical protein
VAISAPRAFLKKTTSPNFPSYALPIASMEIQPLLSGSEAMLPVRDRRPRRVTFVLTRLEVAATSEAATRNASFSECLSRVLRAVWLIPQGPVG